MPRANRVAAAVLISALTAGCATPSAGPRAQRDWVHEAAGPGRSNTLLIVLHGSKAGPEDEVRSWRRSARIRGWDLLSYGHADAEPAEAPRLYRDLRALVRRVEEERGRPYRTIHYAGSSRGGRLAVGLAGRSSGMAVVSMAGAPQGPFVRSADSRVLLVSGEQDPVPESAWLKAEQELGSAGYSVRSRRWPGQGHLLDEAAYEDAARWLERGEPAAQG